MKKAAPNVSLSAIPVTFEHGIVVRRRALAERSVSLGQLLATLEVTAPSAESPDLLAFGPHFGAEATDEFIHRLNALGLRYVDDFVDLHMDHPQWLRFFASKS
jgi:hypothetical protein